VCTVSSSETHNDMKKRLNFCLFLLVAAILTGCVKQNEDKQIKNEQSDKIVLSFAYSSPSDDRAYEACKRFSQALEERTDGTLGAKLYFQGELGSEKEILEQCQYGGIDIVCIPMETAKEYLPGLHLGSMPDNEVNGISYMTFDEGYKTYIILISENTMTRFSDQYKKAISEIARNL